MGNVHAGATVPLNEEGYRAIASMRSDHDMCIFVERILARDGRAVTNRGSLSGFVPYYSGTKSVQSYQALCNELRNVPWAVQARPHHGYSFQSHRWNPNAMCDGIRAEERADWLVSNMGMTRDQARGKVMDEFPTVFGAGGGPSYQPSGPSYQPSGGYGGGGWDPMAMCDGINAQERANWLQNNKGMSWEAAKDQVMREFPNAFRSGSGMGGGFPSAPYGGCGGSGMGGGFPSAPYGGCGGSGGWDPMAMCDGRTAQERATWLQTNQGMSWEGAKAKVMSEFPQVFRSGTGYGGGMGCGGAGMGYGGGGTGMGYGGGCGRWKPNTMCGGSRAEDRADWLIRNQGMNREQAQQKVMSEFPGMF